MRKACGRAFGAGGVDGSTESGYLGVRGFPCRLHAVLKWILGLGGCGESGVERSLGFAVDRTYRVRCLNVLVDDRQRKMWCTKVTRPRAWRMPWFEQILSAFSVVRVFVWLFVRLIVC